MKKKRVSPENSKLKEQLARALADYDNLVKRTEKERGEWLKFANQNFVVQLLPVLDNLERAQAHLQDTGLALAIDEFKKKLEDAGIVEIETSGSVDPNFHEIVEVREGGEEGTIAQVQTSGYRFVDGLVIRPARVVAYKAKEGK